MPAPEMVILALLLIATGHRVPGQVTRGITVLLLTLTTVLKVADLLMLESLGRRFNIIGDLPLIDASVRLLAGSLGIVAATGVTLVAGVLVMAILAALWWATGVLVRLARGRAIVRLGSGIAAAGLAGALMTLPHGPLRPLTRQFVLDHARLAGRTLTELRSFRADARRDALATLANPMERIDRDVLVIFLESYGRTSFDTPLFADRHLATLAEAQARLTQAGLGMRSGFLTSPTHGGQSWLAHATLANGLLVNDQIRYRAAIASGRQTLFHRAAAAGFRTAAVMPAIVRPWPEASTMGFQTIIAAPDMGYRGLPFNWVTMPDQYTLAVTDRLLRDTPDPRPLFAQVVLISSHAPWVPVPWMVEWDQVGDGRIFDAMAQEGDPPEVVWRDRDRVRAQYRDAIDYTLQVVMSYAERQADDPPLMVLVGDHQAAGSIGLDERREVPIHVIGPPALVERTAAWGLATGLIPPRDLAPLPMEDMRDLFLHGFSGSSDTPPA